jgi:hypothetical protein
MDCRVKDNLTIIGASHEDEILEPVHGQMLAISYELDPFRNVRQNKWLRYRNFIDTIERMTLLAFIVT